MSGNYLKESELIMCQTLALIDPGLCLDTNLMILTNINQPTIRNNFYQKTKEYDELDFHIRFHSRKDADIISVPDIILNNIAYE